MAATFLISTQNVGEDSSWWNLVAELTATGRFQVRIATAEVLISTDAELWLNSSMNVVVTTTSQLKAFVVVIRGTKIFTVGKQNVVSNCASEQTLL